MDTQGGGISESSRRIARNTILLYFRMGLMMIVGLVSSRIIIQALGVTDWGVYGVVSGVITGFMLVMNTVASAITRYVTVALGKKDEERLKTVFGTSVVIMAAFCGLLVVLTETAGLWYVGHKLDIPPERMNAAFHVLEASMVVLILNLISIPYTAVINAHEHMSAYAWISILEATLKLGVAALVWFSSADRLVFYAWLLALAALLSRGAYVLYSRSHFEESRGKLRGSMALAREMGGFAGWNFVGSATYMLNTQGINQLMNLFFGVGANAARGVADKVEQVVRQFATNIALAVNPQLTKSYVNGNRTYAYVLACKASKYYFWVLWILSLPFFFEAETILRLWLGVVPEGAAIFTKLTLLCFLVDFTPGTLTILQLAKGSVKRYYLITSAVAVLTFPLTWALYHMGFPAKVGYIAFAAVYLVKSAVMLWLTHVETGLPVGMYMKQAVWPMLAPSIISLSFVYGIWRHLPDAWWAFLVVAAAGVIFMGLSAWVVGLTPGEKAYVKSKLPWLGK